MDKLTKEFVCAKIGKLTTFSHDTVIIDDINFVRTTEGLIVKELELATQHLITAMQLAQVSQLPDALKTEINLCKNKCNNLIMPIVRTGIPLVGVDVDDKDIPF